VDHWQKQQAKIDLLQAELAAKSLITLRVRR